MSVARRRSRATYCAKSHINGFLFEMDPKEIPKEPGDIADEPIDEQAELELALVLRVRVMTIDDPPAHLKMPMLKEEAERLVKEFLDLCRADGSKATLKEISLATGVPITTAWKTEAWTGYRQQHIKERRLKTIPLTPKMLQAIGQNDPGDAIEAAWQMLLEQARPAERAALHAMTAEQRAEQIKLYLEQRADDWT